MTNREIHSELSLLGVSSEVHALVDDLDLDFGVPPQVFCLLRKRPKFVSYAPLRPERWNLLVELRKRNRNRVYFTSFDNEKKTGWLF